MKSSFVTLVAVPVLVGFSTVPAVSAPGEAATVEELPADPTPRVVREEIDEGSHPSELPTPGYEGEKRTWALFPQDDLFPSAIAGPHQRGFGFIYNSVSDHTLAATGDRHFGLRIGGLLGLVRVHPKGRPDRGWQVGFDAGFYGQFDIDENYDNIGWDGFYGLGLTHTLGERTALRVGLFHTSSHVGDEYAERTGRLRIDYTRQELAVGLSFAPAVRWRTYGEVASAFDTRNEELQEPGRLEWGLEYQAPETLSGGRLGWYVAFDANAFEERDWEPDLSLQIGFATWSGGRRWRLGLELYDGRVPIGEFFFEDQRSVSLGLYMDP